MTIPNLDSRKGLHPINQKKNEYWKQWIEWSLESRMTKGIIYDQTSLPDLLKNAANPEGRHDYHLWPISNQWIWPHETCHRGVCNQHSREPKSKLTVYVSLRKYSDIPRIWHQTRPLRHHAEGSFFVHLKKVQINIHLRCSVSAVYRVFTVTPEDFHRDILPDSPNSLFYVTLSVWNASWPPLSVWPFWFVSRPILRGVKDFCVQN